MERELASLIRLELFVQRDKNVQGGSSVQAAVGGDVNPMIKFWQMDVESKIKPFKAATE